MAQCSVAGCANEATRDGICDSCGAARVARQAKRPAVVLARKRQQRRHGNGSAKGQGK